MALAEALGRLRDAIAPDPEAAAAFDALLAGPALARLLGDLRAPAVIVATHSWVIGAAVLIVRPGPCSRCAAEPRYAGGAASYGRGTPTPTEPWPGTFRRPRALPRRAPAHLSGHADPPGEGVCLVERGRVSTPKEATMATRTRKSQVDRSAAARKAIASRTPQSLKDAAAKAVATRQARESKLTKMQKQELAEVRQAAARKAIASRTPKQLKAAAAKAIATRQAREAKMTKRQNPSLQRSARPPRARQSRAGAPSPSRPPVARPPRHARPMRPSRRPSARRPPRKRVSLPHGPTLRRIGAWAFFCPGSERGAQMNRGGGTPVAKAAGDRPPAPKPFHEGAKITGVPGARTTLVHREGDRHPPLGRRSGHA